MRYAGRYDKACIKGRINILCVLNEVYRFLPALSLLLFWARFSVKIASSKPLASAWVYSPNNKQGNGRVKRILAEQPFVVQRGDCCQNAVKR